MFRSSDNTHAIFRIFSAALLVVSTGCEELGIGPNQESSTDSAPVVADSVAPVTKTMPADQPPVQLPVTPAATPETMVADFIATRSDLITDAMILNVAGLAPANSQITEINLRGAVLTRSGLAAMAQLPELRKVDLSGCVIPVTELEGIGAVTQLEELELENAVLNNATLAVVAPLIHLKKLNISKTTISDEGFQHLTKLTKLESINCQALAITGAGFEAFTAKYANAPLKEINVNNTTFGTFGFKHLVGMKQLESLAASQAQVTDDALKELRGCTALKVLQLAGNSVTDQGFKTLNGLKSLENVDVSGNVLFGDFTLGKLGSCESLKILKVQGTACSLKGIEKLKKTVPECVIHFNNTTY